MYIQIMPYCIVQANTRTAQETEEAAFSAEVMEFLHKYDLISDGHKLRQADVTSQIDQCLRQKSQLEDGTNQSFASSDMRYGLLLETRDQIL